MNPYKVAAKVARVVGAGIVYTLAGLSVAAVLAAIVFTCLKDGWGWWTLLLIPGIPAAFIVMGVCIALGYWVKDSIVQRWKRAERAWESKQVSSRAGGSDG